MATYGDKQEPGIITTLDSAFNVSTAGAAPSDLGIVGQADLTNGSASANTVYEITKATTARNLFGDASESLLTQACIDALIEGAYPVYAVATSEVAVTGEDLSGLASTSGTLANAPVSENGADTVFTIDGTAKSTNVIYTDPHAESPAAGEVYLNPVTGDFELDAAPADTDSTNDTADYTYFDYPAGNDAMRDGAGADIDFLVALSENKAVADDVQVTASELEQEYNFSIALVGPGDTAIDPSTYVNPYDDSRVQVVYGTRFEDNTSLLAAYAGQRAALGLDRTPINVSLESNKRIASYQADDLNRTGRGNLGDERVVPLADEATGPRIVDDPTSVTDTNADEANIDYGFTRLLMDYVIAVVRANEKPFIGRLNNPAVRNTFRDLVDDEMAALKRSGSVLRYTLGVSKVDATTASLELSVEVAKPIRFIENDVTVGESAAV